MRNKASMMSNMKRRFLSSALAGTAVMAALVLQPMTLFAETIESVTVTGFPEPAVGQDIPEPMALADNVQRDPNVWITWAGFVENGHNCTGGQFQAGHTYGAGLSITNRAGSDVVDSSTKVTINGKETKFLNSNPETGSFVFESATPYVLPAEDPTPAPAPAPEPQPAPAPAPAPSPQQQNEQAALQQQAIERELQAAGVTAAAPASIVATVAPNGDFTNVKNIFSQAMKASPSIWGVYSRAAGGNTNAIYTMFSYALNGDQNALLALYAAASSGNPYAITSLQLLGLSL